MIKIIFILGLIAIYTPRLKSDVIARVQHQKLSSMIFLLAELIVVTVAFAQMYFLELNENLSFIYFGLFIFVCGVVIATSSRLTLQENYMPAFAAKVPRRVISEGTYRFVRHPIYLGMMLVVFGFELTFHSALAGVSLLSVFLFTYQIGKEESAISTLLQKDWIQFTEQTQYKLIPFVW